MTSIWVFVIVLQTAASAAPILANNRTVPHPRMILNPEMLAKLRARALANTTEWRALKDKCDALAGMPVLFFDESGNGIGEGYQGGEYYHAVISLGLCRQVLLADDANAANRYGVKLVKVLQKMSDPKRSPWPGRDSGYGIRFYGIGMAYAYDWAYDLLDSATKAQIWQAINRWITIFETDPCCDWEWAHPNSNYFASYYHAKAAGAIATEGDNPKALEMWENWIHEQHEGRVQPFFSVNLAGGGWPEGFPNYGPLALLNHSLVTISVLTAKGIDLVHASAAYEFPFDSADYLMHFTWPNLTYTDDRGAAHAVKEGQRPAGAINPSMFISMAGILNYWHAPNAAVFQQYAEQVREKAKDVKREPWQEFLLWDPNARKSPIQSLPRSYFARGLNHVAARSDWSSDAAWMSFIAGTYVNNPAQGEQGFDEGSLTLVRGGAPLLVNAATWLMHNTPGTQDGEAHEKAVYAANYGKFNLDPRLGNRDIYSIFYVRDVNQNGVPMEPYGQGALGPGEAGTRISQFEDRGNYVFATASKLEDMYRQGAKRLIEDWTRQVVYLRPRQFLIYDETVSGDTRFDQFLAWNFPAPPLVNGKNRFDFRYNSSFAGSMIPLFPENVRTTSTNLFGANKVWREEVRPGTNDREQRWLTVFDLSASADEVSRASRVECAGTDARGVLLESGEKRLVVIFVRLKAIPSAAQIVYRVAQGPARHVIVNVEPNPHYGIAVSLSGSQETIAVSQGGALRASPEGVLTFGVNASGEIEP